MNTNTKKIHRHKIEVDDITKIKTLLDTGVKCDVVSAILGYGRGTVYNVRDGFYNYILENREPTEFERWQLLRKKTPYPGDTKNNKVAEPVADTPNPNSNIDETLNEIRNELKLFNVQLQELIGIADAIRIAWNCEMDNNRVKKEN